MCWICLYYLDLLLCPPPHPRPQRLITWMFHYNINTYPQTYNIYIQNVFMEIQIHPASKNTPICSHLSSHTKTGPWTIPLRASEDIMTPHLSDGTVISAISLVSPLSPPLKYTALCLYSCLLTPWRGFNEDICPTNSDFHWLNSNWCRSLTLFISN